MKPEVIMNIIGMAVALIRAETRKQGLELSEDAIATMANTLRPLLGLAVRFHVTTATIEDQRKAHEEPNHPTL